MANPALNEKAFERIMPQGATQTGWGAPTAPPGTAGWPAPNAAPFGGPMIDGAMQAPPGSIPPSGDPASPWVPSAATKVMTVNGSITATAALLVLLSITAILGWNAVEVLPSTTDILGKVVTPQPAIPVLAFVSVFVALGFAIATILKPKWARVTAPLYALAEGYFLGAISAVYNAAYQGIVVNAIISTFAVLGIMLFLFATRIIRVTEKMRMIIFAATGAIMLTYLVNMVFRLFGSQLPLLNDAGPLGIGISVAIVIVAAFNLLLDFDFIEKGVAARAPKETEWYAAFGLLVTLVWLYLELLRLLAKLQRR